jgi:hypothetical protein
MVLTIGLAAVGSAAVRLLPKKRNPTSFSLWVTTSAGCSKTILRLVQPGAHAHHHRVA